MNSDDHPWITALSTLRRSRLIVAPLLLALLVGCRGDDSGRGAPGYGGTLVIAAPTDLDFANSLVSREVFTQELILHALFVPLLHYDSGLGYEPRLARSWELIGDTTIIFHLRDDIYWHDGEKTTAHDVAFTFARARDPQTTYVNPKDLEYWKRAEVIDSFTIRFTIRPHPDPLDAWAFLAIMPHHLLDSIPPARLRQAAFNHNPVGNGPFRFVSTRSNERWVFAANDDFPEELGGRPQVDRLVWLVIPESSARTTELLTGGADLVVGPSARELRDLDADPSVQALIRPSRKFHALIWNGRRRPFDDPRVRRALTLAINRHEILQVLRGGYGELATGPIFPAHWAYDSDLEPLPFDREAARRLLAEAGYHRPEGRRWIEDDEGRAIDFELMIPTGNEYNRNVAAMVQAQLAAVGVRVRPRLLDFAALVDQITAPDRRFDAVFLGWESGFRLDLGDIFHSEAMQGAFQFSSYSNPEIDSIIDLASRSAREVARPLWHRLQEILLEDQPWAFFYYTPDLFAMRKGLRGVEMDIRGAFTGIGGWWKTPGEVGEGDEQIDPLMNQPVPRER